MILSLSRYCMRRELIRSFVKCYSNHLSFHVSWTLSLVRYCFQQNYSHKIHYFRWHRFQLELRFVRNVAAVGSDELASLQPSPNGKERLFLKYFSTHLPVSPQDC